VSEIRQSILETIGRTPLVRIRRLFQKPGVEILAKLELLNPLGSVKERIAAAMVEGLEREGKLRPGVTIVESSSGNTGIGLAMVCAVKGYRLLVTMSRNVSVERRAMLRALGAELVLVDGGSDDAWDEADRIAAADPARTVRISQYDTPYNVAVHYQTTGPEIWEQSGGRVDVLVATLGTTGTIVGAGRYLRERNPKVRIVAVQPDRKDHAQQGIRTLRYQRVPPIWDPSAVDATLEVGDEEAFRLARALARQEGIFGGISCGTAMAGAIREAERLAEGTIVTIFPDRGERYLSTPLYTKEG
jgi:cysteinyl-tRNA synthetase